MLSGAVPPPLSPRRSQPSPVDSSIRRKSRVLSARRSGSSEEPSDTPAANPILSDDVLPATLRSMRRRTVTEQIPSSPKMMAMDRNESEGGQQPAESEIASTDVRVQAGERTPEQEIVNQGRTAKDGRFNIPSASERSDRIPDQDVVGKPAGADSAEDSDNIRDVTVEATDPVSPVSPSAEDERQPTVVFRTTTLESEGPPAHQVPSLPTFSDMTEKLVAALKDWICVQKSAEEAQTAYEAAAKMTELAKTEEDLETLKKDAESTRVRSVEASCMYEVVKGKTLELRLATLQGETATGERPRDVAIDRPESERLNEPREGSFTGIQEESRDRRISIDRPLQSGGVSTVAETLGQDLKGPTEKPKPSCRCIGKPNRDQQTQRCWYSQCAKNRNNCRIPMQLRRLIARWAKPQADRLIAHYRATGEVDPHEFQYEFCGGPLARRMYTYSRLCCLGLCDLKDVYYAQVMELTLAGVNEVRLEAGERAEYIQRVSEALDVAFQNLPRNYRRPSHCRECVGDAIECCPCKGRKMTKYYATYLGLLLQCNVGLTDSVRELIMARSLAIGVSVVLENFVRTSVAFHLDNEMLLGAIASKAEELHLMKEQIDLFENSEAGEDEVGESKAADGNMRSELHRRASELMKELKPVLEQRDRVARILEDNLKTNVLEILDGVLVDFDSKIVDYADDQRIGFVSSLELQFLRDVQNDLREYLLDFPVDHNRLPELYRVIQHDLRESIMRLHKAADSDPFTEIGVYCGLFQPFDYGQNDINKIGASLQFVTPGPDYEGDFEMTTWQEGQEE